MTTFLIQNKVRFEKRQWSRFTEKRNHFPDWIFKLINTFSKTIDKLCSQSNSIQFNKREREINMSISVSVYHK